MPASMCARYLKIEQLAVGNWQLAKTNPTPLTTKDTKEHKGAETHANLGWLGMRWDTPREGRGGAQSAPRSGNPVIGNQKQPNPGDELCKPFRFLIGYRGRGAREAR